MQASPSGDQASSERDEGPGLAFDNSEAHDDPVDAREDVSWVDAGEMAQGSGALRVLMTDAPIDADSVFVTICGIYVQPVSADGGDAIRGDDARPEPGGDGSVPRDRDGTEPSDRGEPDDRGEPKEMIPPDADPGADPAAPADDHPEDDAAMAAGEGEELTDEERDAAERERIEAERERIEAERERIEAERRAAEADGRGAPPPAPTDGRDREVVPERGDGADGEPPRDSGEPTGAPRGWYTVSDQCQTVDLLTLQNGVTEAMGLAQLPAGAYGQVRLMLTEASLVRDGLRQRLEVPSGDESGLKVVGGFSLYDGEATTLTLDFDAAASVVYTEGRLLMRPVIRLVDVTEHGQRGEARDDAPGDGQTQPRPATPDGSAGAPGRDAPAPGTDPRRPPEGSEPRPGEPDVNGAGSGGAGGSSGSASSGGAAGSSDSGA